LIRHYSEVLVAFQTNLDDSHSFELVLDTLTALRRIYRAAAADKSLQPGLANDGNKALDLIVKALAHEYAKINAEGLRVTASLVHALSDSINTSNKHIVAPLISAVLEKLKKTDIDQEVKTSSLIAMASIVSVASPQVPAANLSEIVRLFAERLDSELTRDAALKGFTQMASSNVKIAFQNLPAVMSKLLGLLKKNQRTLHVYTFEAMIAFLFKYGEQFGG
jgi:hypothetical protein